MPSESAVAALRERLASATTTSEILAQLVMIRESFERGELSRAEVLTLRSSAFNALKEATREDSTAAERLILEELVPDLVSDLAADRSSEAQVALSRYYEYLGDWVEQYAPAQRDVLRAKILQVLGPALDAPRPEPACWAIARLGYRSSEL